MIHVVEEKGGLRRTLSSSLDKVIESGPIGVVDFSVIPHFEILIETTLKPLVEINQVRVYVVPERLLRKQP